MKSFHVRAVYENLAPNIREIFLAGVIVIVSLLVSLYIVENSLTAEAQAGNGKVAWTEIIGGGSGVAACASASGGAPSGSGPAAPVPVTVTYDETGHGCTGSTGVIIIDNATGNWVSQTMYAGCVGTQNYSLTCGKSYTVNYTNSSWGVLESVALNTAACPAPPPGPTASLTPTPGTINYGQSTTLNWSSTNTTSCVGTGFSTGGATSGSIVVSPTSSQSYSVSCTGPGGTVDSGATVTVIVPAPIISLTIAPSLVAKNGSATLSWSVANTQNCSITGPSGFAPVVITDPLPGTPRTGTNSTGAITQTSTYTLSCEDLRFPGTFVSVQARVNLRPDFQEF